MHSGEEKENKITIYPSLKMLTGITDYSVSEKLLNEKLKSQVYRKTFNFCYLSLCSFFCQRIWQKNLFPKFSLLFPLKPSPKSTPSYHSPLPHLLNQDIKLEARILSQNGLITLIKVAPETHRNQPNATSVKHA